MGVIFDEPKYPVIDKAPGFLKTGNREAKHHDYCVGTVAFPELNTECVVHRSGELQHKRLYDVPYNHSCLCTVWLLSR